MSRLTGAAQIPEDGEGEDGEDQGEGNGDPDPLDFTCPVKACKAPPGVPCGNGFGRALSYFHPSRERRAKRRDRP